MKMIHLVIGGARRTGRVLAVVERGDLHVLVEAVEAEVVPAAEESHVFELYIVGADAAGLRIEMIPRKSSR